MRVFDAKQKLKTRFRCIRSMGLRRLTAFITSIEPGISHDSLPITQSIVQVSPFESPF